MSVEKSKIEGRLCAVQHREKESVQRKVSTRKMDAKMSRRIGALETKILEQKNHQRCREYREKFQSEQG